MKRQVSMVAAPIAALVFFSPFALSSLRPQTHVLRRCCRARSYILASCSVVTESQADEPPEDNKAKLAQPAGLTRADM